MRRWHVLLVVLLAAACATPRVQQVGPRVETPRLEDAAFVTADGARLAAQSWQAATPTAIIVGLHGMNDYARNFSMPAPYWVEQGISVFAYDQRGFGRSPEPGIWPGTETLADDAAAFIAAVRARHPGIPLYVMGDSMGGAVALTLFARADAPHVDGLILVAPAVWGWKALNPFYKTVLWVAAHTFPGMTLTGSNLEIRPTDNIELLRELFEDPLMIKATRTDAVYGLVTLMDAGYESAEEVEVPTLVLYGEKDQVIPREPVETVIEKLNGKTRTVVYESGYHMLLRDLQAENVWRDIVAWIDDPIAALPSGEEKTTALRTARTSAD